MIREGLAFDDVLLIPKHSAVESRSKVDISVKLTNFTYAHPIIPANMKTVTGKDMAIKIAKTQGLAILHRFMPIQEQIEIAKDIINQFGTAKYLAMSIGVKSNDLEYLEQFYNVGVRIICIDIAHGDSRSCESMIASIKNKYPDVRIIAGNVATADGAERLWMAGAHIVKVGVGPGSLCTTRIETGNGVPQLTAIMDVAERRDSIFKQAGQYKAFIADGGIKSVGDIVKALCFADMVMIGNMFAGCDETPGSVINIDGRPYKEYVGSSTHKANHIEGVAAMVPYKGSFDTIFTKMVEGLKSGCSYQGAHNLVELRANPTFIKITNAGLKESHPHDVIMR